MVTVGPGAGRLARALPVAVIVTLAVLGAARRSLAQPAPGPREAMIAALGAPGPHPSLGAQAKVFDRLVGTWDCEYTFFLDRGAVRHSSGELRFGWIIDGRALQDIWITYPNEAGKERSIGTSVRFFDPKAGIWRVVFVAPAYGGMIVVQGGAEGDGIVLRGKDAAGAEVRWSFNDITENAFVWRGETSKDDGRTWRLEEEHHMTRRAAHL